MSIYHEPAPFQPPVTSIYKKLEVVGKGAYGAVYKGVHIPTGAVVALKIINLDQADDDTADIQREVALLSQLRAENNNITKYYGCYLNGPQVWIVMDFANAGSVRTLMKCMKGGVLEERWMVIIMREVLIALAYLHKSNVIHRDIKTANVLVQSTGKVMLCDFGVSALLSTSQSKRTTFIGTPHYMAPEVLTSSSYDSKADIWSLGITLYEMATGAQPLAEIPQLQAITLIPKVKPPRLPEQYGSKDMKDFINNCLRELPSDRLPAEELSKTLWIKKTAKVHVSILGELVARYEKWQQAGGIRSSLAQPAPWEMKTSRSEEDDEDASESSSWEFDTIRSSLRRSVAQDDDSPSNHKELNIQAPESLRALFDDGDGDYYPSALAALEHQRGASPLPMSTSLLDISRNLDNDGDLTARLPKIPQYSRHSPNSHDSTSSDQESSQSRPDGARGHPRYRERRNMKGVADLSIPNADAPHPANGSTELLMPPSQTRPDKPDRSGESTKANSSKIAPGPSKFQFPRLGDSDKSPAILASSQLTPIAPARPTNGTHELHPKFAFPGNSVAASHSSHASLSGASSSGASLVRKPSLNRQASVAVMENVSSIAPRPPAPLSQQSTQVSKSRADTESSSRPGIGLKDFLKLSPLPPEMAFGADMLPPSPSVMPHPPKLPGLSGFSQSNPRAIKTSLSSSASLSSSPSPVGGDISSGSDAYNAAVTGPPLRALNFGNLVQSRDETHAELARTVDDLAAWLQVVEGGLAMLLAPADDDAIEEEDEESYES